VKQITKLKLALDQSKLEQITGIDPGWEVIMSKKQLLAIFIGNLVSWTVGNGLLPLLPVYAIHLGADPAAAGYYLSFSYVAIATGALTAGWISDRFHKRRLLLIITGVVSIPIAWLMGQATGIVSLTLLTAALWFCGGVALAGNGILASLSAGENERGRIFGILSLTIGLGGFLGGTLSGYLVENWGFPGMLGVMAGILFFWPSSAYFLTEKEDRQTPEVKTTAVTAGMGSAFYLLLSASLVGAIGGFIVLLVRSLVMDKLGFGALAISSTAAVGSIISIPIPFLAGWWSDRYGRKTFLYAGYAAALAGVCVLAFSTLLWQFLVVVILGSCATAVLAPVNSALVTDLLSTEVIGKGFAMLNASGWVGGIFGFAGGGIALEYLGPLLTIRLGIWLAVLALVFVIPIRLQNQHTPAVR